MASVLDGKYTLVRKLGTGGMAEVFLARQSGLQGFEKLVVVKRVLPHLSNNQVFSRMFLDEARIAADLRHPNIINLFDIGQDGESYYLAMEYLDGPDLRQVMKKLFAEGRTVPAPIALHIALDVARALHYAHTKCDLRGRPLGIVHRDVSPQNVVVTRNGVTKLLDFGVARAENATSETAPGVVKGKIRYMAPEQAQGRPLDGRADLFGLGVVLYEMTTGKLLFEEALETGSLEPVIECRIEPPTVARGDYPPDLEPIVMRALARDIGHRYPNCEAFATDVKHYLQSHAIPLSQDDLAEWIAELFPDHDHDERIEAPEPTVSGTSGSNGLPHSQPTLVTRAPAKRRSTSYKQTNLTNEPASFVGRQAELEKLRTCLADGYRLITVHGPGGCGKTRLAQRAGLEEYGTSAWSGGVWFCDATEARSLEGFLAAVGGLLEVPLTAVGSVDDTVARIARALAGRGPIVVILDNLEQIVEAATEALAVWMQEAPQARFVVTSQALLKIPDEHALELEPFPLPDLDDSNLLSADAIRLFVDRARAVRSGWEPTQRDAPILADIVRRLDGLPLAIELAAARMRVFSLADLQEHIAHRFELLAGRKKTSARQSTLRGAIDWSWSLLNDAERSALRQCSVFRGGFTLEAAMAVIELEQTDDSPWVPDVVESLLDKSLIRTDTSTGNVRFTMLDSIREYAAEKLEDKNETEATHERHASYYLRIGQVAAAQLTGADGMTQRRLLITELENLVAVSRRAARVTPPTLQSATRALRSVLTFSPVMLQQGPMSSLVSMLTEALARSGEQEVDPLLVARTLEARGLAYRAQGNVPASQADIESALELAREVRNRPLEGRCLSTLAYLKILQADEAGAREAVEEAIAIHTRARDEHGRAHSLCNLAVIENEVSNLDAAREHFAEAVHIFRRVGDKSYEGIALTNLAGVFARQGRYAESIAAFEEASRLLAESGNRRLLALTHHNLGVVQRERGEVEEAQELLDLAVREIRQVGDQRFEGVFVGQLGCVEWELGRLESARDTLTRSVDTLRAVGDTRHTSLFLSCLGAVEACLGHPDLASSALDRAEKNIAEISDPSLTQIISIHRGHLELARQQRDAAELRIHTDAQIEQTDDTRFALRILQRALK